MNDRCSPSKGCALALARKRVLWFGGLASHLPKTPRPPGRARGDRLLVRPPADGARLAPELTLERVTFRGRSGRGEPCHRGGRPGHLPARHHRDRRRRSGPASFPGPRGRSRSGAPEASGVTSARHYVASGGVTAQRGPDVATTASATYDAGPGTDHGLVPRATSRSSSTAPATGSTASTSPSIPPRARSSSAGAPPGLRPRGEAVSASPGPRRDSSPPRRRPRPTVPSAAAPAAPPPAAAVRPLNADKAGPDGRRRGPLQLADPPGHGDRQAARHPGPRRRHADLQAAHRRPGRRRPAQDRGLRGRRPAGPRRPGGDLRPGHLRPARRQVVCTGHPLLKDPAAPRRAPTG